MFLKIGKQTFGQTLIEAVVALAMAMLIISALAVLATRTINDSKFAENKLAADNLLSKTFNEVRTVRDQQGWGVFSSYDAGCYIIDPSNWILMSKHNCPNGNFNYSSCVAPANDFVDWPLGSGNNFFCRKVELTAASGSDTNNINISVAWKDSAGDHTINSSTTLTKWYEGY